MTKILLTAPLPGIEELKGDFNITILNYPTKEEVIKKLPGCIGLISLLSFEVDKDVIDGGSDLRVIANYAVGYDNIDIGYATRKSIYVLNTPDVLTRATAELTWALIFAVSRRLIEGDRMVREERFPGWQPDLLLGLELKGSTLGIIGGGRIGSEVARIGIGLGLNVIYFDINRKRELEKIDVGFRSLDELLQKSDIISLHLPLTEETKYILNRERLQLLKPGAILINTGRGPLVDEKFLITLLKEEKIHAGLDVYENEPRVPEELTKLKNVVLLPHIGSATRKARFEMARLCFDGIRKVMKGEIPPNCINPSTSSGQALR